ncbi:hypothetical protein J5893_03065 [bacterium]|nr:hypothetical protein [bacterium]
MTFSTGLTSEHQYQSAGLKTLQQYITFSDGTKLLNIASFFVKNPLTMQSLALNISGSLTYYQQEPLAL